MMWYLTATCFISTLTFSTTLEMKKISVLEVTGVWGQSAGLPCDVSHPPDDGIHLLLWFRDSLTTPIYRFDERWQANGRDPHWADENVLGTRASLDVSSSPAILRLSSIIQEDQGLYRCRVDFRLQPTKTTRVKLIVVVPPEGVSVVVEGPSGKQKRVRGVVGPLQEGDTLQLICIANGGIPPPLVVWFENTQLIDSHMESKDLKHRNTTLLSLGQTMKTLMRTSVARSGDPFNILSIGPLTRNDLKLLLTCEASNNNLTLPTSVVVMVDMLLPPLTATIRGAELPWIAGQEYLVQCEVRGSRPPPSISWWNGDQRVMETTETSSLDGNVTTSSIVLKPRASQDGSFLRCRAESRPTNTLIEDTWNLVIHYAPTAVSTFGSSLDVSNIKEGDDVYFECAVVASPRASHISWRHNNEVLVNDVSSGIIISSNSLALQKVVRSQAGFYSCHAHNLIGDGASNNLRLDIKYAPFCTPGQTTTYPVSRFENAEVRCWVEANPQESTFQWMFNNTADTINVPKGRFSSSGSKSVITYTPMASLDYGTLLCWATNKIGRQKEPCAFQIVPADKPDPLTNCSVKQRTRTTVRIDCQAGNSRGLTQTFHLEAREKNSKHTVNVTASNPTFSVKGLNPGLRYNVMIIAINEKGRSIPQHLTFSTLRSNGSLGQTQDGPFEAEVREEAKTRESPVGGPTDLNNNNNNNNDNDNYNNNNSNNNNKDSSANSLRYSHLFPAALGLGAGLILVIFILLFLIIFRTCHTRHPRHLVPPSSTAASVSDQTRSVLNSPVLSAKHSTASCNDRELQIESESEADPDIIPLKDAYGTTGCPAGIQPTTSSADQIKYSPVPTIITCKTNPRYSRLPMSPSKTAVLSSVVDHPSTSISSFSPSHSEEEPYPPDNPQEHKEGEMRHCSLTRITLHAPICSPEPTPTLTHRSSFSEVGGDIPPPLEYQSDNDTQPSFSKISTEEEDASSAPLLTKRESSV